LKVMRFQSIVVMDLSQVLSGLIGKKRYDIFSVDSM
jgi:hypothetical protein